MMADAVSASTTLLNATMPPNAETESASRAVLVTGPAGPGVFPLGNNLITFRAVDAGNNVSQCNSFVNVVDTKAPTIKCPQNVNIVCTGKGGTQFTPLKATGSDSCSGVVVTNPPAQFFR